MKLSAMCIRCQIDRQEERIRGIADENKKSAYLKEAASLIASASDDASAPYLIFRINAIYKRYFGEFQNYEKEKSEFNLLMLELEAGIEEDIRSGKNGEEILKNALKFARAANYIDFAAANQVKKSCLYELLRQAKGEPLDETAFARFRGDLEKAEKLAYLTDNCGEIVADKLLIRILQEQYPQIEITAIVRGEAVVNDATMEDARRTGLTQTVKVIGNGNGVAGTEIAMLSGEARQVIGSADIVISKGQGNFETLYGCGLNIYYLFLCKCEWFTKRFGMERLKGVFVNERDVRL